MRNNIFFNIFVRENNASRLINEPPCTRSPKQFNLIYKSKRRRRAITLNSFPLLMMIFRCRFVIGQYVTVHGDVISHVNISHVMVEDGGEYTCTAENRAGKTSHSARLNIYGELFLFPFTISDISVHVVQKTIKRTSKNVCL